MNSDFWKSGAIGVPWAREEDYPAFRAMFEDAQHMPANWKDFTEIAEASEEHFKAQGHTVKRIYIDAAPFLHWCGSKGYRVNARARLIYAWELAQTDEGPPKKGVD